MTVYDAVLALLADASVPFDEVAHPDARTAEEAAALRGTSLAIGGKSLVMKLDKGLGFVVAVVGGDRRLANPLLRKHLGVRRYRFATEAELLDVTGLTPGCVPPFGRPVFDLPLYVDAAVADQPRIAFTPGRHDRSIVMATADWLAAAAPAAVLPLT